MDTLPTTGPAALDVVVRAPVPLPDELMERLTTALARVLARPVALSPRLDHRVTGIAVQLDARRQVVLDLRAPERELDRRLEGLRESRDVDAVLETIGSLPSSTSFELEPTNLRRLLDAHPSDVLTLRTRVPLDPALTARIERKLREAAGRDIALDIRVEPRLDAGAALYVGGGDRIVLDARYRWLEGLEHELVRHERAEDPGAAIREAIECTEPDLRVQAIEESGGVIEVADGVAVVSGLQRVGSQELVEFENGTFGLAFNLLADRVGCILLGPEEGIRESGEVSRTGHLLKVPVGERMLGRIVDALGRPLDGKGPIPTAAFRPIERKAAGIIDRLPVDVPLHTGIKVIDALVPLGRGQRELIIGDRKTGKTTIAVDTILSQKGRGVRCVYAAIGQKASSVAAVVRTLEEADAMEYTTVVVALPNEQPAFRYITPYTACAIGEYYMDRGEDALVVYDDLSKHAVTYREMSALLKRPIGREAYPGDIFYVHSRLLERAAHLSDEHGGGSLTALPIVETLASDVSAFIPTNVISICDGQIVLDANLFNEGHRPALDAGLSVSRVGGSAQTKATKRVAGRLRVDLAQFEEMAQFVRFGAEVDDATMRQLARGERCRELLKQAQHSPMGPAEQVAVLFAGISGLVDDVPVEHVPSFERDLLSAAAANRPAVFRRIDDEGVLDDEGEAALREFIERLAASFDASCASETSTYETAV